jgi:hypothetical protein
MERCRQATSAADTDCSTALPHCGRESCDDSCERTQRREQYRQQCTTSFRHDGRLNHAKREFLVGTGEHDDRQRGDGAEPDDAAKLVGRFGGEVPVEAQHVGGVVGRPEDRADTVQSELERADDAEVDLPFARAGRNRSPGLRPDYTPQRSRGCPHS